MSPYILSDNSRDNPNTDSITTHHLTELSLANSYVHKFCNRFFYASNYWHGLLITVGLITGNCKVKDLHKTVHRVSKNVPHLACYNFNAHEWIWIFFGRNVTDKVGNQKTLYYATSNNLCFCTIPGKRRKHENHIFHSIGLCYTHNALVRYLPERKEIVIGDVFDSV